ncbi:unnamed protein product [Knipowitschia caucasica]|uniref:Uncharacterized protein n=1 Tax=Knipowitschia caucasica TaxID=637954 RepID=A0AAV2M4U6_KNICA
MSSEPLQHFRAFITESFTAVAVNVFNEVQNLVQTYEDENKRLRSLLNSVLLPEVQLSRIDVGTGGSSLTAPQSQSQAFPEIVFKEEQMECVISDDVVKPEPDQNPVSGPYRYLSSTRTSRANSPATSRQS